MMNNIWSVLSPCIRRSLRLLVLAIALVATANGQIIDETPTATGLSAEILQSRIDQLRESSAYDEETRIAALELYQRAGANLSAAAAYDESAERFSRSITEAPAEAATELVSGAIESSNVNVADALVDMIEFSRKVEFQVKMMKTAQELDASSAKLMQQS